MSDFSFMKTGHNLMEPVKNNVDNDNGELLKNVNALLFSFIENALKTCETYIDHGKRNTITKEDIRLGLMLETFEYIKRNNTGNIEKWKEIIEDEDGEEDSDSDYDEECDYREEGVDDNDKIQIEKEDVFKWSNCKCETCCKINNVEDKWEVWKPRNQIENILRNAILEI